MAETFIVLLAAHLLADFILQTDWIMAHKSGAPGMAIHIAIVVLAVAALAGSLDPVVLAAVSLPHLALDLWKQHLSRKDLAAFLVDQLGHLFTIAIVAWLSSGFVQGGVWASPPSWAPDLLPHGGFAVYLQVLIVLSGAVIATQVGGFAIGLFVQRFALEAKSDAPSLEKGGFYIGLLERGLIFLLVLTNHVEAVGFLIAAKSVLRFGVAQERPVSEYVIIGTLASVGWALLAALATQHALAAWSPPI